MTSSQPYGSDAREAIAAVLMAHWPTSTSGCHCGQVRLGHSWPLHVADHLLAMVRPVRRSSSPSGWSSLQADLDEIERTDPAVAAAAASYDRMVERVTGRILPERPPVPVPDDVRERAARWLWENNGGSPWSSAGTTLREWQLRQADQLLSALGQGECER